MIIINGKPAQGVDPRDRALAYGDGLFETIACVGGRLHNWQRHYQRLEDSAHALDLHPPSQLQLEEAAQLFFYQYAKNNFTLKIILSRGVGGRGYAYDQNKDNQWIMLDAPWPEYPADYYQQGITAVLSSLRLSIQPYLAGHKHLNRLEQVWARHLLAPQYPEAILCDYKGLVVEGIQSNIFWISQQSLYTPTLTRCGVKGTVRSQIMDYARAQNIPCYESDFELQHLLEAGSIFFCNSIIGIWPVKILMLPDSKQQTFCKNDLLQQLMQVINLPLQRPC